MKVNGDPPLSEQLCINDRCRQGNVEGERKIVVLGAEEKGEKVYGNIEAVVLGLKRRSAWSVCFGFASWGSKSQGRDRVSFLVLPVGTQGAGLLLKKCRASTWELLQRNGRASCLCFCEELKAFFA